MSGISSGYGHAELGSYLGSVFTLANTAGELACHRSSVSGGWWFEG